MNNIVEIKTLVSVLLLVAALLCTNTSMSADADVSLSGDAVKLSKLDDLKFGAVNSLGADRIQSHRVCIYSTTGAYRIKAAGQHPTANGRNPRVSDDAGNFIRYRVFWKAGGQPISRIFSHRSYLFKGAHQTEPSCGAAGTNALLEIRVTNKQFKKAPSGAYKDTLTLTVEAI